MALPSLIALSLASLGGAAPPAAALRVTIETVAVDRRGTWTIGTDVADVFPGSAGVLEKSATLFGRQESNPPREMVQLKARVTPSLQAGAACALRIEAETTRAVSGARVGSRPAAPDRTSATVVLKEDESRLVEVYASPITQGRLALKVRCGAPAPAEGSGLQFIDFTLSIERADGDADLQPLKSNRLRAAVGREASDLASFNLPLPEGKRGDRRYRKEEIEAALSPVLVSGGQVQIELRVHGELVTVSATEPKVTHPVDRRETLVLSSGEPHTVDLEIRSSDPDEGWSRVRYRFDVVSLF